MKRYVDGFVLLVPKKNMKAYQKMADMSAKMWIKYGALEYVECKGNDLKNAAKWGCLPFTKMTKAKPSEEILYSFIVYKSKAQRDQINKKIMNDPKMKEACDPNNMPFDMKKMAVGGFESIVYEVKKK